MHFNKMIDIIFLFKKDSVMNTKIAAFTLASIGWLSIALANPHTQPGIETHPKPNTVALTFDDGPSPKYTPQILAILKKEHIKATFFVMGGLAKRHPELVQRIKSEGHAVALHTMTHPKLTRLNDKQLHYEIIEARENVRKAIGINPMCLRPPYGLINSHVRQYIEKTGMTVVPIGFNSFDYENRGVNKLEKWVLANVRSGRVFLMHDGYNHRQQTVDALPTIIKGIREKGLGFSAICYP